jgi:PAS domain S-box-containing protein
VLASALDAIIVMDAQGLVREFNAAAEATFGYRRDEAIGRPLADLIVPPALRERHREGLRRYLATGDGPVLGRRIEIAAMRSSGAEFPVELAIVPFDSDGERMFAGYIRDLSEKVRQAEELRRSAALSRLLLMLPLAAGSARSVDEAIGAAIEGVASFSGWTLGHAWRVQQDHLVPMDVWWSEAPERHEPFRHDTQGRVFRRGEGLPGQAWAERRPVWARDVSADPARPRKDSARASGLAGALAFPILVEGRTRFVLEFFAPDPREPDDGLLSALTLASHEVGRVVHRFEAAADLEAAHARAVEASRSRQRFLSQAAHELGSPLSAIRLQLTLLQFAIRGNDRAEKAAQVIERNVTRLNALHRDLADAGRLGEGRLAVERQQENLLATARDSVASIEPAAQERGVEVELHGAEVSCWHDPVRIGQLLDNLLRNALRFTPPGGRIEVRVSEEDGEAVVRVADNGYGIDPAALTLLFQPFTQVHDASAGPVGGSGLGLYISRGIARAHGGDLTAQSPGRGQGSTFTLRLPLASGPAASGPALPADLA